MGDKPRAEQGNTLGCVEDDDVKVSQHLFALRLSAADTKAVLQSLQRASVVTDPSNEQLVKLTDSPDDLSAIAKSLGQIDDNVEPLDVTLSVENIRLISK